MSKRTKTKFRVGQDVFVKVQIFSLKKHTAVVELKGTLATVFIDDLRSVPLRERGGSRAC